MTVLFA